MKIDVAVERAKFEAWIKDTFKHPNLEVTPKYLMHYAHRPTEFAWLAWQAVLATMPERDGEAVATPHPVLLRAIERVEAAYDAAPTGRLDKALANLYWLRDKAATANSAEGEVVTDEPTMEVIDAGIKAYLSELYSAGKLAKTNREIVRAPMIAAYKAMLNAHKASAKGEG